MDCPKCYRKNIEQTLDKSIYKCKCGEVVREVSNIEKFYSK